MITNLFAQCIWFSYDHIPAPTSLCLAYAEHLTSGAGKRALSRAEAWWDTTEGSFKLNMNFPVGKSVESWYLDRGDCTREQALQAIRLSDVPPAAFMYQKTRAPVGGEEVQRMLRDFKMVFFGRRPAPRFGRGDRFLRLER